MLLLLVILSEFRGNVKLVEIDGPVVKLELVGACGSCASSATTMAMGIERALKERIPGIAAVVESKPVAPDLSKENVEIALDTVRPFIKLIGGELMLVNIMGVSGLQPRIGLRLSGTAASLHSVKLEITEKIQAYFHSPLRVDWT